jgi:gp16 family phage-associated protein
MEKPADMHDCQARFIFAGQLRGPQQGYALHDHLEGPVALTKVAPPSAIKAIAQRANRSRKGNPKTANEVWAELRAAGMTAREWADSHGFEPSLVYSVLSGDRKCLRGQSHKIAKALGLK